VQNQSALQSKLFEKFQELKLRNPRFSLRAFSIKLGIGAGPVSQILAGKRRVSAKLAAKICDRLLLDPQERSEVLAPFSAVEPTAKVGIETGKYLRLSQAQFLVISKWQHFAILSLIKIRGFRNQPKWLARRLGLSEREATAARDRLIEMKILRSDENGKLRRLDNPIRTADDITDLTVRAAHFETLELAKTALAELPVERRDFTTLTLPMNPEKLGKAKELIREFQDKFDALMETTDEGSEVYRLSMELFPLTKPETL